MNIEKIQKIVSAIDVSGHPLGATLTVGVCTKTGRPKVSVGLHAPDTSEHHAGIPVKTDVKAGGIGWPPHTVVFESDDEQHVVSATLQALDKATAHENREWFRYKGQHFENPHPQG
jgi:hypothetical protein